MKKILSGLRGKTLFSLLMLTAILTQTACYTTHKNWVNINYVFKPGLDSAARKAIIDTIKRQFSQVSSSVKPTRAALFANVRDTSRPNSQQPSFVTNFYSLYLNEQLKGRKFKIKNPKEHFCSCKDSLLWNLTADLKIGGSGQSAPTSPSPVAKGGVEGGAFDQLDNNGRVGKSTMREPVLDLAGKITFPQTFNTVADEVLAVIDTGIDTTLYDGKVYGPLLTSFGGSAINVMPDADSTKYQDGEEVRHGSAVTAIALRAFYEQCGATKQLPRVMAIKALDDHGYGSTFSISCGLSYAIRNKATLINASLGYWGKQDSVLSYYLERCKQHSIPVIAAAGNDTLRHEGPLCSDAVIPNNLLVSNPSYMFYPACLSNDSRYSVITVTGMNSNLKPCRFQFYSSTFVDIGVVTQDPLPGFNSVSTFPSDICCGFRLPFINNSYALDGSSFATPVISGQILYNMVGVPHNQPNSFWLGKLSTSTMPSGSWYTKKGKYIVVN
ncbi:MAG: S8/S53 family peptidase [Bacteroidetes bacterium]|nr:S8/S53 family peptidase [Bacteroidota bacterium]